MLQVIAVLKFWVQVHCSYRFLISGQLLSFFSSLARKVVKIIKFRHSSIYSLVVILSPGFYTLKTFCIARHWPSASAVSGWHKLRKTSQGEHSTAPVTPVGCTVVASVSSYTPPPPLTYCSASLQHHMLHMALAYVGCPPTKGRSPPGDQQ